MIVDSLDEYIDILSGHLYDNDKVVTYKWLSKELEVHVNIAKQILWEFTQRHKEDQNFEKTFLLMGTLNDGGTHVEVVKDKDLSTAKAKFSNIIAEHIYSLQKALPDIELLAISGEGDVKFSAIQCNESTERSDEEMHLLRWGKSLSNEIPVTKPEVATEKKKDEGFTENETAVNKQKKEEHTAPTKKVNTAQKKGFDSLFGKAKSKPSGSKPESSSESVSSNKQKSPKNEKSPSPKQKKGSINNFFESTKQQQATIKKQDPEIEKEAESSSDKNDTSIKTADTIVNRKPKAVRGKKRSHSKELNSNKKKRKRITVESDSSDSEIFSHSEEEEEEEQQSPSPPKRSSPPKDRSPSPPPVKHEGGKRKVLKMVDKTFEEDGYLVTKKVHVYESCSEEEPEKVEVKKSSPPESRDTKAKKTRKQTTLMNFFKKS